MNGNLDRYSRQILFSGIGEEGQKKLLSSYAIVIGCGALGTVQANALARAGVGRLLIVDRDFVEESNLQRQILFDEEDAREKLPKAIAARKKLQLINSQIEIDALVTDVNYKNIEEIIKGADVVLDGVDNFETRFLLNDACVKHNIPWVYGACVGSYGITMTIIPKETPCVRCVFETAPPSEHTPTCDTAGIVSSIVNVIASIQVAEAIKLLTGQKDRLHKGLIAVDLWSNMFKTLDVSGPKKSSDCPTCKQGIYGSLEADNKNVTYATSLCGRNAVQITKSQSDGFKFDELAGKLRPLCEVNYNNFILYFSVDGFEISVFADSRAIIKGTNDPAVARSVYSKYIGS